MASRSGETSMAEGMDIKLEWNVSVSELLAEMIERRDLAVRKTAFSIEASAEGYSAVDTGAQKNGVYVVTAEDSTYAEAVAEASESYKTKNNQPFPAQPQMQLEKTDGSEAI